MADDGKLSPLSPSVWNNDTYELPEEYKFMKLLGEGGFGKVFKCWKKDTRDIVAVKVPKFYHNARSEVGFLKTFMRLNFDQRNIVKFFDSFHVKYGQALVFEKLDMSLEDFILRNRCAPLMLSDVRSITMQVATAFEALQSIRVIHTDLKPDNIMLVDHRRRPLAVKLIDFGLAITRSKAKQGSTVQTVFFRAPEILLGLPFTEAIDMWSLGCVMATMLVGCILFPAQTEYEALQLISEVVGPPDSDQLEDGTKVSLYYKKTLHNKWRLKTPLEYWGHGYTKTFRRNRFSCLDDIKKVRLERAVEPEAAELGQSIELVRIMLTVNQTLRIDPREVLKHPFIRSSPHARNDDSESPVPTTPVGLRPSAALRRVEMERGNSSPTLSKWSLKAPRSAEKKRNLNIKNCTARRDGGKKEKEQKKKGQEIKEQKKKEQLEKKEQKKKEQEEKKKEQQEKKEQKMKEKEEKKEQKKGKKAEDFARFFGWFDRTFCCCVSDDLCCTALLCE